MKIQFESLTKRSLILYLGISIVFWFGPIKFSVFPKLKMALFVFVNVLILLEAIIKNKFKFNIVFTAFSILSLGSAVTGLMQSGVGAISRILFTTLIVFLITNFFYVYFRDKTLEDIVEVFTKVLKVISFFCVVTILNFVFDIPSWKFVPEGYKWGDYVSLYDTGFSTTRTSWSNGLSMFFCMAVYFFYRYRKRKYFWMSAIIVFSQFISGGRAGLLISILFILYLILFKTNIKIVLLVILTTTTVIISQKDYIVKRLRIDRLIEGEKSTAPSDFTSGRLEHLEFGLNKLLEGGNLFVGDGFFKKDHKINDRNEIHNFWIKRFLEGGLVHITVYIAFVIFMFRRLMLFRRQYEGMGFFIMVFIAGLITTFFEPNTLFGSIQSTALWWVSLSAFEALRIQYKDA